MESGGFPRIVVAAPASGAGKTIAATALAAAFAARGRVVQPFKAGPDYIDPGYHALAAGRPSRNLDVWMLGPEIVRGLFRARAGGADLSIVEGVMGLFDGLSPASEAGSTAELAKILAAPVLLVVDVSAQARSAAALVWGFARFDPALPIAGVIANRVGGETHAAIVREALAASGGPPLVGAIPQDAVLALPERHLGLVPAWEAERHAAAFLRALREKAPAWFDLARIEAIARGAPAPPRGTFAAPEPVSGAPVRVAFARDAAFRFYYADNLDLLSAFGAEPVPVSPLSDAALPEGTAGIYLGGGFPERHAEALTANRPFREALRRAAAEGLPIYAECGGLMALAEGIRTRDGRTHPASSTGR